MRGRSWAAGQREMNVCAGYLSWVRLGTWWTATIAIATSFEAVNGGRIRRRLSRSAGMRRLVTAPEIRSIPRRSHPTARPVRHLPVA
jgi:hypothetical protein